MPVSSNLSESSRMNYRINKGLDTAKNCNRWWCGKGSCDPATIPPFDLATGNMGLKVSKSHAWPRIATPITVQKSI